MMKSSVVKFMLGLSMSSAVVGTAVAQQPADSISMNLDKVLEIALSDNPSIKVANQDIEIKKYAKKETITGLFPNITASGTASKSIILQKMKLDFAPEPISMGQPYVYALTGTATLPLVAPQLWKTIQLNQSQVELALEAARSSKIEAISQVKSAYYQMLLARDSYEVLQANYNTSRENTQNITAKFAQGSVAEYDTLVAYVQTQAIEPQILAAKNGVKLAEMQLKVLMGVDVNEPLKFEGSLTDYEEQLFADLLTLKSDTSLVDNSAIKQLDLQKRQLILAEKINKLGYVPTLAFSFQAGYQGMSGSFNPFDVSYFPGVTAALALSIPIFDGGAKYMKTKQNNLTLANLDTQRENLLRQLELAISSSLNNIETAAEQVVSNKASVNSAMKAYAISQKRFQVGSGTQLEMNSSETAYLAARLQYVQSIYDFLSSRAALEATLGKLVAPNE